MDTGNAGWDVIPDATDAAAYAVLRRDKVWNCFAIADLAPPFRAWTEVAVARERRGERYAACLVLRQPGLTVVSPFGAPPGVAAILERIALPARALVQARDEHLPPLERHYCLDPSARELLRLAVTPATFRPPPAPGRAVARLTAADLPALLALYERFPENHFQPDALRHGVFYGIHAGDRLAAAGGTHAMAPAYGIAVLGGIFTHPDERRRGHAGAVTAALVGDLFARGCADVVLNVTAENAPALRVYERLGFRLHSRYRAGQAERIAR